MTETQITTGVDRLVNLIKQKREIATAQASKELGVSENLVKEWANILEEEGVLDIKFKFATEYLIQKTISNKDLHQKVKEFHIQKYTVLRKAETLLAQLQEELHEVGNIKQEFAKVKQDVSIESDDLKKQFSLIQSYEHESLSINKRLAQEYAIFQSLITKLTRKMNEEKRTFDAALSGFQTAAHAVEEEKKALELVEKTREKMMQKMNAVQTNTGQQYQEYIEGSQS